MDNYSIPDLGCAPSLSNSNNSLNFPSFDGQILTPNLDEFRGRSLGTIGSHASPPPQSGSISGFLEKYNFPEVSESDPHFSGDFSGNFDANYWGSVAHRFYLQSVARSFIPEASISSCLRFPHQKGSDILIDYSAAKQRAYYANLMTCKSIWNCPCCSSRGTEGRRVEVGQFVNAVRAEGDFTFMVTYTLQHDRQDSLKYLLEQLTNGRRHVKAGKRWQRVKRDYGLLGSVRSLEITTGLSGWHPHVHELFVSTSPNLDLDALTTEFKSLWQRSAVKYGFDASWEHGVDVRFADGWIDNYIAKFGRTPRWREEHEIAKSGSKIGRSAANFTPFQLLQLGGEGLLLPDGRSPRVLFREYAQTMKGRYQMKWSRGLREHYGLGKAATDKELVEAMPDDSMALAAVDWLDWVHILRTGRRAELLQVGSQGSLDLVWIYLHRLRQELGYSVD